MLQSWTDSTFVTKENGEISNQFQNSGGGDISFFIPESYTEALDSEMTRTFLLYLPDHQGHPKADIDTITFKYRFKLIEEVICYDYQQIIYNDSLYHSGKYQSLITFTK